MEPKRQNHHKQEKNQRIESILAQRKKKIEEALWARRSKTQSTKTTTSKTPSTNKKMLGLWVKNQLKKAQIKGY